MRIEYRRSGGVAGIDMSASIGSEELPAAQAQLADQLLSTDSTPTAGSGAPDGFSYVLTVQDGERTRTHQWRENEVPDTVRALLATVGKHAQPAPPA